MSSAYYSDHQLKPQILTLDCPALKLGSMPGRSAWVVFAATAKHQLIRYNLSPLFSTWTLGSKPSKVQVADKVLGRCNKPKCNIATCWESASTAFCSGDGQLQVFSSTGVSELCGQVADAFTTQPPVCCFDQKGRVLIVGGEDGSLQFYNLSGESGGDGGQPAMAGWAVEERPSTPDRAGGDVDAVDVEYEELVNIGQSLGVGSNRPSVVGDSGDGVGVAIQTLKQRVMLLHEDNEQSQQDARLEAPELVVNTNLQNKLVEQIMKEAQVMREELQASNKAIEELKERIKSRTWDS